MLQVQLRREKRPREGNEETGQLSSPESLKIDDNNDASWRTEGMPHVQIVNYGLSLGPRSQHFSPLSPVKTFEPRNRHSKAEFRGEQTISNTGKFQISTTTAWPFCSQMSSQCPTCGALTQPTSTTEEPRDSNVRVATKTLALHQKLLNSNVAPEGAELVFFRSVVSKTGGRLGYLDDEIARLRNQLKELEEEHAVLSSYHAQNRAILSPLRRMPPEVLGQIFSWTLPSARTRIGRDLESSPWILTHISSRWRAISLSTPSLWSLVVTDYAASSRYPLPMLETQIARARNLKIHFYGSEKSDSQPQVATFQCLARHSSF
ncbi:hypothetical protein FB451DRAFT_1170051 [Mycena latifolia]|nr:hypothetical protein FB451DRAFT_1170051 [Mycena latifolia]